MNIKGFGCGNGLTDPINQYPEYAPYLYNYTAQVLGTPLITLKQ